MAETNPMVVSPIQTAANGGGRAAATTKYLKYLEISKISRNI